MTNHNNRFREGVVTEFLGRMPPDDLREILAICARDAAAKGHADRAELLRALANADDAAIGQFAEGLQADGEFLQAGSHAIN